MPYRTGGYYRLIADNRQWLDAGLGALEQHGAPGLTIERLLGQVGLSKGSFYHHFGGMPGYKTALLAHYEATYTTRYLDAVEQHPGATARAKLDTLLDLVMQEDDHGLEVALRAWALQDPEVRRAQERIDRIRVEYLYGLWLELSHDEDEAALMSRLLYLIVIGGAQIIPYLPPEHLRPIYDFVLSHTASRHRDRAHPRPRRRITAAGSRKSQNPDSG